MLLFQVDSGVEGEEVAEVEVLEQVGEVEVSGEDVEVAASEEEEEVAEDVDSEAGPHPEYHLCFIVSYQPC